ncbi:MAG: F510_1955 family glycosylhydrolase [Pseudonocardiaceae bacterium]
MGGAVDRPVWRVLQAAGVAAALAVLAGCGTDSPDVGMEHVHALGVDPGDGVLYAASHHGLFRIQPGSEPQRVGSSSQDTMGFFIIGPGYFLGSGHPAPGEDQPANLGLIESSDAGVTWAPVSLSGEVDFHTIDVKQGTIFGYDSQTQQIMVSSDRTTWERRAQLPLADLAASPDDPQFLLGTTAQGLAHSADGGRTFIRITSAPTLKLVDWSIENLIFGVGPTGIVGTSSDHGATWARLGTVEGVPAALATNGPDEVYVATDRGIYASTDGGRNFTLSQPLTPGGH